MTSLSLWLVGVGSRLATTVLSTANVIVLARVLGPESMGQYFVFVTLVTVLSLAADFGMSPTAAVFAGRQVHQAWSVHRVLLQIVPVLSLVIAVPAAVLFWIAGDRLLPAFAQVWMVLALVILPLALYANFWNGMMIGMRRVVRLHLTQLLVRGLALALNLAFVVLTPGGIGAALVVYSVVMLAQALLMLAMACRILERTAGLAAPPSLRHEMFRFGLRSYPGLLSDLLWARSTVLLLNGFHGHAAVGVFSVGQQFAERMLLPTEVMQNVIYRRVCSLPRAEAASAMNQYLRVTIWAMLPILLLGAVIAPSMVPLLLGSAYADSATIIPLLLYGSLVMIPTVLLTPFFMGQLRRPGLLSILGWLHVLTNVAFGLLLIPRWVELGAALSLVGSQLLGAALLLVLYARLAPARLSAATWLQSHDVAITVKQVRQILWRPRVSS